MEIHVNDAIGDLALEPLSCTMEIADLPAGGTTLDCAQAVRLQDSLGDGVACIVENLWPSSSLLDAIARERSATVSVRFDDVEVLRYERDSTAPVVQWILDDDSLLITYPWQLLEINSELISTMNQFSRHGIVRDGVTIDGELQLGRGSVLLPGVYVEGNVVIGENCKIGPNCYLRGETAIYDNCRVGNGVEIKNSIMMDGACAGHLTYLGDSIVGPGSNLGAGTITANFRHDGKNHRSMIGEELIDTGRNKLGTVIGADVHTGINTSIYPGRKIWPKRSTLPGEIVKLDVC